MPQVNLKQVGVVILNWNGLDHTLRCLESILKLPELPGEVLVIDNGSTPRQDAELLRFSTGPIRVKRMEQNLGFAGGCNLGIRELLQHPDIKYILLLNNDAMLTPGAISALVQALHQPHIGLAGARMMRADQLKQIENRGLGLSSWGLAWNITNSADAPSLASGGCVLLSREMIEQVNVSGKLFDESLFLYVEDVDLGLRALAHGWKSVTVDEAVTYHVGSASTKKDPGLALYYWHRNVLWVMLKNFPALSLWLNVLPVACLHLAISVIYTFRGYGGLVWKAKWDALLGVPRVLRQRRELKAQLNYSTFRSILYSNWKALHTWRTTAH